MARGWVIGLALLLLAAAAWILMGDDDASGPEPTLQIDEPSTDARDPTALTGRAPPTDEEALAAARAALPPPPTGPYEWFAMSGETEGPLAGVEIATEEGERIGATGPNGVLRIEEGDATSLSVIATLDGHLPARAHASAGQRIGLVLYPGIRIRGHVRNALNGEGIYGAQLQVWDIDSRQMIATMGSGEEGAFEIASVRPNHPFRIVTTAPGFVPTVQTENFDVAVDDLLVEVGGGGILEGRLSFRRGGAVDKREILLVNAGRPVPGRAGPIREQAGLPGYEKAVLARTVTDEDGLYRFVGIRPGRRVQPVFVVSRRFEARGGAALIRPEDGEVTSDIEVGEPSALRIHVVDGGGRPIPQARVHVQTRTERWAVGPKDRQADGSYLLPTITPGKVHVHASLPATPTPMRDPSQDLDLKPGFEGETRIEFPDGTDLVGEVVDPDGEPVLQAQVRWTSLNGVSASAPTNGEGRFRLRGLPNDGGTLIVRARNVLNSRIGYEDHEKRNVAPGPGLVRVTLKRGTQVTGRFPDLDRDALLEVALEPTGAGDHGTTWMDKDHRFEWRGFPPDRMGRIVFRTPGYAPIVRELFPPFRSEEIRDLGDLQFETSYPALGKVVDRWGKPIRAAKVTLSDPWFHGRSQRTNRDGEFEFSRVPERDVPVVIEATGIPPNRRVLKAESHKRRQVIRVDATGRLPLTVMEPSRNWLIEVSPSSTKLEYRHPVPVAHARVRLSTIDEQGQVKRHRHRHEQTDKKGKVELELTPGHYRVEVRNARGRTGTLDIRIGAGESYPNTIVLETNGERKTRARHEEALAKRRKQQAAANK